MDDTAKKIALALIDMGAVGIDKQHPLTFKSGMVSPIYVDNRNFPFHPEAWRLVIEGFAKTIERENIKFDVIGGIESAGIPHSAALGYALKKPSVFIRKETKDHGTKKMVEGGEVKGKTVLLIEDLVTTGGTSLRGVQSLRNEGAVVNDCLAITNYGFEESTLAFGNAGVKLHFLTSVQTIVEEGHAMKKFSDEQVAAFQAWVKDPYHWRP